MSLGSMFGRRWLTACGWLGVVPADFVMSRDMLRGVKQRAEAFAAAEGLAAA